MRISDFSSNFPLSLVAAASSIALVLSENHVHIHVMDPSTYVSMVQHKCGCVMLACISWALAEFGRGVFYPADETAQVRATSGPRAFAGRMLQ